MTFKDKILLILLVIFTLGFYLLLIKKGKKNEKNELTREEKTKINIDTLMKIVGKENITKVSNTQTKVTIHIKSRDGVEIEEIQKLKGISGVFTTSSLITILVGKSAKLVKDKIKAML